MKTMIVSVLVVLFLVGCSSDQGQKAEKEKNYKNSATEQAKQPKRGEGLHDKELAERGIVRDKEGNFGSGSLEKALGGR